MKLDKQKQAIKNLIDNLVFLLRIIIFIRNNKEDDE